MLPGLSLDSEAALLGVAERNEGFISAMRASASPVEQGVIDELDPLHTYVLKYWSDSGHGTPIDVLRDFARNPTAWEHRYSNYCARQSFYYTARQARHSQILHRLGDICASSQSEYPFCS